MSDADVLMWAILALCVVAALLLVATYLLFRAVGEAQEDISHLRGLIDDAQECPPVTIEGPLSLNMHIEGLSDPQEAGEAVARAVHDAVIHRY